MCGPGWKAWAGFKVMSAKLGVNALVTVARIFFGILARFGVGK